MGITFDNAALLLKAKRNNAPFGRLLTIGHLNLYLSKGQLARLAERYGVHADMSAILSNPYADLFFQTFLGSTSVDSIDYSEYEKCDIVHDMNIPIDSSRFETYDAVIDGGSLEHIFNFPVAISNCMQMVRKGGSLFLFTMADNHVGHGFYQFSPELFFRIFRKENGFQIQDVILAEHPYPGPELSACATCYSVVDPEKVGRRVGLVSPSPVMMMVHAVRTDIRPLFETFPIQSDYSAKYLGRPKVKSKKTTRIGSILNKLDLKFINSIPFSLKKHILGRRQLSRYSFRNSQFYTRWHPL